jgi:pyroglutamyl-peptidase
VTTVLLTGFEPFGGDSSNPSGDAVRLVAAAWTGPETLVTAVLPVTFDGAAEQLAELIEAHSPDVVIATGLAGGRAAMSVERIAVNLIDARIPDNDGAQPVDQPSVAGGASAHFTSLPAKAIVRELAARGIPSELSHSAGTFVCNHTFYVATDAAARRAGMRAGFIHVPWDHGRGPAGSPTLSLDDIAAGMTIAVRTTLDIQVDIAEPGGSLH